MSYKHLFILFLITTFIFCCKISSPTDSEPADYIVVTFSDVKFETLIRETLSQPNGNISITDMLRITRLSGYEIGISNIDGIEYCKNLMRVNLRTNQISDISGFAELTKIYRLNLWTNKIKDISALAGLINLDELYLGGNEISDIYPLVQNQGIDSGDRVVISLNPLSETLINTYIPQLIARGVNISY